MAGAAHLLIGGAQLTISAVALRVLLRAKLSEILLTKEARRTLLWLGRLLAITMVSQCVSGRCCRGRARTHPG